MKNTYKPFSQTLRFWRQASSRVLGAILLVSASGIALAETPPPVINFGFASPKVGNPPQYTLGAGGIAYSKGWIDDEFKSNPETKIEYVFFKGAGPAVNEALANNQLDFAFQGDLPAVVARSVGLKTRLLLANNIRNNIYLAVPPDSKIRSVEDLKGKRVSFFKGTNSQTPINRLLAKYKLNEKNLKVINLDTASGQAALLNGDIDALFGDVQLLKLRDQGKLKIIYTSNGDSPIFTRQAHILVRDEFAAKYPETTKRVVKVLVKAAHWASEPGNRDELLTLWAIPGVYTREQLAEDYGNNIKLRNSPLLDDFIVNSYKAVAADALQFGLIRKNIEVDSWFDRSFLNAALKELKLEDYWEALDANGKPVSVKKASAQTKK
jgi:sulfonate transport system substrate-binding protein